MPIIANINQLTNGFQLQIFNQSGGLISQTIYNRAIDVYNNTPPLFGLIDPVSRIFIFPATDYTQIYINGSAPPALYEDFITAVTAIIYRSIDGNSGATALNVITRNGFVKQKVPSTYNPSTNTINTELSYVKIPRIKITSAKTNFSSNPVNTDISLIPTHKGIVQFNLQIEENFTPDFLDFRPFVELRMFKSLSNGKYTDKKKSKTRNITSPKSPNGFIYSDVNSKYKSNNSLSSDGYNQICEVPLELPYLICDPAQGYNFVENTNLGDYNPVTNTPDISNIYTQKGNYYSISADHFIPDFNVGNVKIGDKIIWDGSRIDKIKKNKSGQSSLMRFDFMPHGFYGLAGNGISGTFDFPVRIEDWNNKPETYRNRRSISHNYGFFLQKRYKLNEQTGNFEAIPNRGKSLIVGFRVGIVSPNSKEIYYGEDSVFVKIKPAKTQRNPETESYYYDWSIESFVF